MEVISCFLSVLKNPINENNWLVIQVRFAQKLLGEGLAFTIRTHVDPVPASWWGSCWKGNAPPRARRATRPNLAGWHGKLQKRQVQEELLTSNSPKLPNYVTKLISKLTAQSSSRWAITSSHMSLGRCQATPQVRTEVVRIFSSGSVAVQPTNMAHLWCHVFNTETCANQQVWPQKVFFHKGKCTSTNIYLIYPSIYLTNILSI